jgi:hypothetical protein
MPTDRALRFVLLCSFHLSWQLDVAEIKFLPA